MTRLFSSRRGALTWLRSSLEIEQRPIMVRPCGAEVTRCFVSTSRDQNRRKIKSLSKRPSFRTTRDRLRLIIDRNELPARHDGPIVSQLLSTAEERLTWLRTKVLQHWNPDYQPDSTSTAATASSGNEAPRQVKRFRNVENARWWFWNIMFALLPSALLAIYCEFRVKPYMEDFYERQKQYRRRQMRDGDDTSEASSMQLGSVDANDTTVSELTTSLWGDMKHYFTQSFHRMNDSESGTDTNPNDGTVSPNLAEKNQPPRGPETTPGEKKIPPPSDVSYKETITIEALAHRLDHLESLITSRGAGSVAQSSKLGHAHDGGERRETSEGSSKGAFRSGIGERVRQKEAIMARKEREVSTTPDESVSISADMVSRWVTNALASFSKLLESSDEPEESPQDEAPLAPSTDNAKKEPSPENKRETSNATSNNDANHGENPPTKGDEKKTKHQMPLDSGHTKTRPWWKIW